MSGDGCAVQVAVGQLGDEPEGPGMLLLRRVRVNGVELPLPRGSRVRLEGRTSLEAVAVTVTFVPSRLELVAEDEW